VVIPFSMASTFLPRTVYCLFQRPSSCALIVIFLMDGTAHRAVPIVALGQLFPFQVSAMSTIS